MTKFEMIGYAIVIYDIHPVILAQKLNISFEDMYLKIKISGIEEIYLNTIYRMKSESYPSDKKYRFLLSSYLIKCLNYINEYNQTKEAPEEFLNQLHEFRNKYYNIREKVNSLPIEDKHKLIFDFAYNFRLNPTEIKNMYLATSDFEKRLNASTCYKEERLKAVKAKAQELKIQDFQNIGFRTVYSGSLARYYKMK